LGIPGRFLRKLPYRKREWNDSILDLVTINNGTLAFYKGLGGGKFANAMTQPLPANLAQVVAADFNRDGKLDPAIGGTTNGTRLLAVAYFPPNPSVKHRRKRGENP
jgi:FG-GAP-like repeat